MAKVIPSVIQSESPPEKHNSENKTMKEKYTVISKSSNKTWQTTAVFHPESLPRLLWDVLLLIVITYQCLTIPYFICFEDSYTYWLNIVEILVNIIFLTDLLVCFNTGLYLKGTLVMKRTAIFCEYIKLWFWIDFVSAFPYSWLLDGFEQPSQTSSSTYKTPKVIGIIRILRFLRILRLIRLAKLKKILIKIEDYVASNTLASIFVFVRLLSLIFFLAHWSACLWFYIGAQESLGHPITWITYANIENSSIYEQYITSLYWAFTTIATVGYGDIVPITVNEKLYTIIVMIISCGIFAYTIGSIGSLISKQNAIENSYREEFVAVNSYMKKKGLPVELQFRVRRYLDYVAESKKNTGISEKQVLSLLSEPLRNEIYAHINSNIIKLCSVFDLYETYFIAELTRTLENETYAPSDTIFKEGELSSKMYFIINGKVDLYHSTTSSTFATLSSQKYFGEIAFFTGMPRCSSSRCSEFVDLLSLVRINFQSFLEKFPEAKEITKILQQKCENGNFSSLGVSCYLCEEIGHVAVKCKLFLVNYDKEDTRKHWLRKKDRSHSIYVNPDIKNPNFTRNSRRNNKKKHFNAMNIIGIPRDTSYIFPKGTVLYPQIIESENYNQGESGNSTSITNPEYSNAKPVKMKFDVFFSKNRSNHESIQEKISEISSVA